VVVVVVVTVVVVTVVCGVSSSCFLSHSPTRHVRDFSPVSATFQSTNTDRMEIEPKEIHFLLEEARIDGCPAREEWT